MDTTYVSHVKDYSEIAKNIFTVIAIIIGGIWAYVKYIRQRENVAKLDFSLTIEFLSKKDRHWIAEISALIENKGVVKHKIHADSFVFELRYLTKDSDINNKKISDNHYTYQVLFDKVIILNDSQSVRSRWLPLNWGIIFIEPGIKRKIKMVVSIPEDAKTLLFRSEFKYDDVEVEFDSAKLIAEVPPSDILLTQASQNTVRNTNAKQTNSI